MVEQAVALTGQKRYVLVAIAVAIGIAGYVFATQSSRSDIPDHGDWWTDMSQMIAARNFTSYGFSFLRFGAMRDNGPDLGLSPAYYTQVPSFPAVALGALYNLGLTTAEARILPLLIASSALIALYILAHLMLGDWRAGLIALLALAASAPYRLLADSFASPSYDFAAKIWTMLFISLAGLASGWRRLAWSVAAGVSGLAMAWLSGIEMVPAIVAYSILFPLFFGTEASGTSKRLRRVFVSGLLVGLSMLAGTFLFASHNAWLLGGWGPAKDDLRGLLLLHTSPNLGFMWPGQYLSLPTSDYAIYYLAMLADRAMAYFPMHLVAIALFVGIGGVLAGLIEGQVNWRPIKWLGIVFLSEVLWLALFRQYTNEHVHTISQLSVSMSLAVAVGAMAAWHLMGHSSRWRRGVAVGLAALFVASILGVGVRPYGNVQARVDWTQQRQRVEALAALTPANAVIVMDIGNQDPSWQLFIGRTFIRQPEVHRLDDTHGRPWFLMVEAIPDSPAYRRAMETSRLMTRVQDIILFDMNPSSERAKLPSGTPGVP